MNVVNATTHANTETVWDLEYCRANKRKTGTAAVKRRIRRQVRQHLAAELRNEVRQLHVDAAAQAAQLAAARRSVDRMVGDIAKNLDIPVKVSTTPVATTPAIAKPERKIMITRKRKLAGSPFARTHVEVAVLVV